MHLVRYADWSKVQELQSTELVVGCSIVSLVVPGFICVLVNCLLRYYIFKKKFKLNCLKKCVINSYQRRSQIHNGKSCDVRVLHTTRLLPYNLTNSVLSTHELNVSG